MRRSGTDLQKNPNPNLTTQTWDPSSARWSYVGFNFRKPYLKDLAVRQAISYAGSGDRSCRPTDGELIAWLLIRAGAAQCPELLREVVDAV